MLLNCRLVTISLVAPVICALALDASNFAEFDSINNGVGCGTSGPSEELRTYFEESLAPGSNITKREEDQKHRIPTYITVLYKNSTIEGGNISDSQIQWVLDHFNEYYSYGFFLDTSVDTVHRYARPDLFHQNSDTLNGTFEDIQTQYHRGESDYASLNIIFVFRYQDWYKATTTERRHADGITRNSTIFSSGGAMGVATLPRKSLWKKSQALKYEKADGVLLSTAIIPDMVHPGHKGVKHTFPHEFGHWLGLYHTDHSFKKAGECDPKNDGIEDTPTHIVNQKMLESLRSCPPSGQVTTCQDMDSRPDAVYNMMVSTFFGCETDGLTSGQRQRTLDVYRNLRMPYKQQIQNLSQHRDWIEQELARLQSESDKALEKFLQEDANRHQEIQRAVQQNMTDCLNQVQREDEQENKRLDEWAEDNNNQLQNYRDGVTKWLESHWEQPQEREWIQQEWRRREEEMRQKQQTLEANQQKHREDMARNTEKKQEGCRQRAEEEEARSIQDLEAWREEYGKALQEDHNKRQQYFDSLQD
ncbi:Peptidase M43, pregnancy-associated plasma-A [Metarhizium rileyi]|uniref:Peptidase M43, pregnancy-associated plasma-A n=1 Tax=Metarhizium rileyi (strain RCEF 4871) TaxID=1649241 RepID=A0A166XFT2_METRR|nr:Peptidase M43, pregnancy-associated plasma-A [Metarhizium rileyi RCEF 4871]